MLVILPNSFADDNRFLSTDIRPYLEVEIDKSRYILSDIIIVTGTSVIPNDGIVMTIGDGSGKFYLETILRSNNESNFYYEIDIDKIENRYNYVLEEGSHFYELLVTSSNHVSDGYSSLNDRSHARFQIISEEKMNANIERENNLLEPSLTFEDKIYTVDDTIILTGNMIGPEYTVGLRMVNPNNMGVASLGFVSDSDANFYYEIDFSTVEIFSQSHRYPKYIINGTYKINIDSWGGKQGNNFQTSFPFEFLHIVKQPHKEITLSFDKELYGKKDMISLTVTAPYEQYNSSPNPDRASNFISTIIDPHGEVIVKKYNGSPLRFKQTIDKDGIFELRFFPKDFIVNGEYTIKINVPYTDIDLEKKFQYNNPDLVDVRNLDNKIKQIDSDVTELRTDMNLIQLQFNDFQQFVNDQFDMIFSIFNN